jgi:hypothetical protein
MTQALESPRNVASEKQAEPNIENQLKEYFQFVSRCDKPQWNPAKNPRSVYAALFS